MTNRLRTIRAALILSLLSAGGLAGCTASQASGWAQTAPTMPADWTAATDGPAGAVNLGLRDADPQTDAVSPAP
ncbi:MAG: hypothetical protein HKO59_12990 [Phycisphaerales bacterium]|nr:hypothetical protein [Phycisphaerae bacterium]NNF43786.1 hypothetical protein [Phycisphaerales bacterium]NNM26878.1 hypothetical protein [Phycisphaerales bacterium]